MTRLKAVLTQVVLKSLQRDPLTFPQGTFAVDESLFAVRKVGKTICTEGAGAIRNLYVRLQTHNWLRCLVLHMYYSTVYSQCMLYVIMHALPRSYLVSYNTS